MNRKWLIVFLGTADGYGLMMNRGTSTEPDLVVLCRCRSLADAGLMADELNCPTKQRSHHD